MDYLNKIRPLEIEKLIHIIENPSKFVKEYWDTSIEVFNENHYELEDIDIIIERENRTLASEKIERLDPLNEELIFHNSYFLTQDQLHPIYEQQLKKHMSKKDGFRFNVWLYALGG